MLEVSLVGSVGFLLSLVLTRFLAKHAATFGMVDAPNERSSHSRPTPKGGGLSFFLVFTLISMGLYTFKPEFRQIVSPLLFGGPAVVLLGWLDDRYTLPASFRLLVHFLVSIFIYGLVTQWFQLELRVSFLPDIAWVNIGFCVLFIAWFINLYNFMDGADGLAAGTGVVGAVLMATIALFHGAPEIAMIYCLLAYSVGGFLFFNWYPAKIFMGDTGSYFLGFVFASLALICKINANISFYSHIIIFGFFIFDTTYVLFRRAFRMEKLFQAHKMFTFHKLLDKGWSHRKVSTLYAATIVLWLFPLANLASIYDVAGMAFVAVAYAPLLAFAIYNHAGEEQPL